MEKPFGCYFGSSVSLLAGGIVQPENTYSRILKVTGQVTFWFIDKPFEI